MAFDRNKAQRVAKNAALVGTRTVGDIIALILKIIGTGVLLAITTGAVFAMIFALYIRTTLEPQIDITLEDYTVSLTSSILSYNNDTGEWEEWITIESGEEREWVEYDRIPENMINAAIAIEDKRFYEHKGVDWYRTAGVSYQMFFGADSDVQGGSTITQQLIKNLTNEDDVTVKRKIVEIFRALEVEKLYDKEEIMEWYLNVIGLGGRINGIGAAAKYYYGTDVENLTLAQCASIIGITQYPTLYNPYINKEENENKRNLVLEAMYEQGYITYEEMKEAIAEPIVLDKQDGATYEMPNYTYYQEAVIQDVIQEYQDALGLSDQAAETRVYYGGLQIYSAVDHRVQDVLDEVYADRDSLPINIPGLQSAMMIMDQTNGYIVGMAGGVGEKSANFVFNRATDARRPPGSAIKPIAVYGPAMEYGVITSSSTYVDQPSETVNGQKWPQNDNRKWSGSNYNIVAAVQRSVNTVAVQVLNDLTLDKSYEFMTETLEIELSPNDYALAPLALGQLTDGITVREITSAYCALANNGIYSQSVTYERVLNAEGEVVFDHTSPTQHQAFKADVAGEMTAILQNAVENGTGTAARMSDYAVAGKTGTTGDNHDRWFCGYTPYYTAACWTGYDQPAVINASTNPACVIWQEVMTRAHEATGKEPATFGDLPSLESETTEGDGDEDDEDSEDATPTPTDEQPEEATTAPEETAAPTPVPATPVPETPAPETPVPETPVDPEPETPVDPEPEGQLESVYTPVPVIGSG